MRASSTESPSASIDIRHLRMIVAISAQGSVTSAARVLGFTQPSLSHQLRRLERRLGTPLFVRTARRMVVTPPGAQLVGVAHRVLAEVDGFERQLAAGDLTTVLGTMRIAAECYTAYHWYPALVRAFSNRWPGVELRVLPEFCGAAIGAIRDGALDLAIVQHQVSDRRIKYEQLFDDEIVVVTAPNHAFATERFVAPECLVSEHLILPGEPAAGSGIVHELLEPAGVVPSRITRIPLTDAIREWVAQGLGVSLLPRWVVAPQIAAGTLSTTRFTREGCRSRWYAATRASDPTPSYQFELVRLLGTFVTTRK